MILNETREMMMKRTSCLKASSSLPPSSSSSSSSSPSSLPVKSRSSVSTDLISSLTVDKHATRSDSCLVQLVRPSSQLTKIEQFSRKLSEFDSKLNGFKPRSGHLNLTNSTTTSSTRLTTTSRSTTGLSLIRSSLPNYISHLTDRELETQHEIDSINKKKSSFCDKYYHDNKKNITIDDSDCWRKRTESCSKRSTFINKPSLTFDSIARQNLNSSSSSLSSSSSSSSYSSHSSKSLQSSPIDSNLGSTDFNCSSSTSYSSSSPSPTSSGFMSSSPSPRIMKPSNHLISSKLKSETFNRSNDCVDYVNTLEESPCPRITRFTRSSLFPKENDQISNGSSSNQMKSARSYSRLNSLPSNNQNDCDKSDEQQSKQTCRNYHRALSIPNGLNGDSMNCYHQSKSTPDSRELLETSNNQRIVGSLLNSPKWSTIKEKFENSDEKEDKPEIVTYSSPQLRRKKFSTTSSNLAPSLSLSNLTLLSSNNINRARSTSLTPKTTTMDHKKFSSQVNNESNYNSNRCSSTSSSSSNSSSSTLTDRSIVKSIDKLNRFSSSGRLTLTQATSSSSSSSPYSLPSSPSYSLDNHGNYPIEKMCNSGKINMEQGSRMKSNSRIAQIASKFDSNVNQNISNVCSVDCGSVNKVRPWKSKSDLLESNKMTSTSSSTSSSSISLLTVHKNSSEQQRQSNISTNITTDLLTSSSSNSVTNLIGGKSITNEIKEENVEKIVSVKETILRLECIKSSREENINQATIKINRSTSDQQSNKPLITPRRKTLPGVTFLHNDMNNLINYTDEKSQINDDHCNENITLPSYQAKESGKCDKAPLPAPRKISNNHDLNTIKEIKSSNFLSSSISKRVELNKNSNRNEIDEISQQSIGLPTSSSSSLPSTTTLNQSKGLSSLSEEIKKTPSFLWSNNLNYNNSRLKGTSCSLSSSLTNVKEPNCKKQDVASHQLNQSVSNINISGNYQNNNNNNIEEPIYEPVSYSPTPSINNSNFISSVTKNTPTTNIFSSSRDNRSVFHDYDDNLSVTSENSSLSYSDSGSYSSGVHELSTLSSSTTSSNRPNRTTSGLASIFPPPLPPRWTEASKQGNSVNTFTTTLTSTTNLINPTSSFGINLDGLETYISNQWNNKDDSYGADHIYDSIHYNNLSDEMSSNKSEMLSKLLKELEDMSPIRERKIKEDDNSTNSYDICISRTPSTLSCSSISRNGSNASDNRDVKSSEEFSTGGITPRSSESNSPSGTIRNSDCSSSQAPPKITPRTTIKSTKKADCDSSGGYANFPSILEDRVLSSGSLMDSILESSSPSLRETIQREMKRSEYHHSRIHHSETLMKNSSFLHSNRLSITSKKSADYVEAIDPSDQKKPNINDLYREGLIHPESRYETHEFEGYMEFKETRGFFSSTVEQPLYQLYDEQVKHNRILWASGLSDDSHDDLDPLDSIYAELDGTSKCECNSCESGIDEDTTSSASLTSSIESTTRTTPHISAIELVGKNGNRQLWCEVPQVKEAGVASKLSPKERKHQEAMFEVITSEASYLKSLDILVNHFMKSEEFSNSDILNPHDRSDLFSNIESVYEITRRLMKDLDDRWQTNVVISDVCDILLRYAHSEFDEYIKYLRFCKKQEKTLKTLQKQPKFSVALKQLETNPKCHGLALTSFLLLPMQRITRYPLLVEAILNHRPPTETDKYEICQKTLASLYKVVNDCNEEAKKTERLQELIDLDSILNFDKVKYFPLISESRHLMKKDEVVRWKQTSNSIIPARGKNTLWKKSPLHLYLFNDLLLIASKKSEICYSVNDYCERNCLTVRSIDVSGEEGTPPIGIKSNLENLVQLTFLKNHARRTSEYYISFPTETDKIRFVEAIEPPKSDKPNEKIYEEWDCPQVICERQYIAQQPDELSLEKSDVVNVFRKTNDWYEGERIRDGAKGWFPASCTQEIVNKHVRSRNLKLRHRLMTLTEQHILEMHKNQ